MNKRTSFIICILVLLIIILFGSNVYSQEYTQKQFANVTFDFHYATWTFEEIPTNNESPVAIYYNVFYNAFGVEKYEQYELTQSSYEKISICKVYYNVNGQIVKWEKFNGQKISEYCEFFYEGNNLVRIDHYESDGMFVPLTKKHYYDKVRYKLEEFMFKELVSEKQYWDNGQFKIVGSYKESKKHGKWIYYNRFGKVVKDEEYVDGDLFSYREYEYGENGEKLRRYLYDSKGTLIITTVYIYNPVISMIDAIEVRQYEGNVKNDNLISTTIAEFDTITGEFISYITYNANCEILYINVDFYPDGPNGEIVWQKIDDKEMIEAYLSKYNYESSCNI